ncbi:MAG: hypothetical protein ACI8S6_004118 [Myxococcota bacterium]|jgi:hypothetical protein
MATRSSALKVGLRAITAVTRGAAVTLPLAMVYGILLTLIDTVIYRSTIPAGQLPGQEDLIAVLLPWAGATLGLEIILGPIVAACAVYVGQAAATGGAVSLYKAVNFALSRYRRVFLPHLAAQLSIQLGLIIIIPGVLFQMQYAFVDSVACLEDEAAPLNRSKRLTRGRRRSVFFLFLPWLMLSQFIIFADLWALGQSEFALFGVKATAFLIYFTMQVGFFFLYEERTRQRRARKAEAGA